MPLCMLAVWHLFRFIGLDELQTVRLFSKNSFGYIVSRLWNNLPAHVREADNLANFKKRLSKAELKHDIYCT